MNHRPGNPGRLVRKRHARDIDVFARHHAVDPLAEPIVPVGGMPDHRARSVHQELAQVPIAAFADTQQTRFAARAVLPGCEPQWRLQSRVPW